jgi:hypothetical protein
MIRAVTALLFLAERKIEEAIARGEFDDLPGAGRALDLDDVDPLLPEELRMAFRLLKNAGYRLNEEHERAERARARKMLALLNTRIEPRYFATVLASCSEMARFRSLYSLQPKKQSLSSVLRCSFALATLPTIR